MKSLKNKLALLSLLLLVPLQLFSAVAIFTVTNTNDSGLGSLRQAIMDSNSNNPAPDPFNKIEFAIPGAGPHIIQPVTSMAGVAAYQITMPVEINGYSQPGSSANTNSFDLGSNAVIKVEIKGPGVGADPSRCLQIEAGGSGSIIKGLAINNFLGFPNFVARGIQLNGVSNCKIEGNFIGLDAAGLNVFENFNSFRLDGCTNCVIGGDNPEDSNVITGFVFRAVRLQFSDNNIIRRNYIGTDKTGQKIFDRSTVGVITLFASDNIIDGNLFSGINVRVYEGLIGQNNVFSNNLVGTDATGTKVLGNTGVGAILTVGDFPDPAPVNNTIIVNNVFSGCEANAIACIQFVTQATNTKILGNKIGTDATGTEVLGNGRSGIFWEGALDTLIGVDPLLPILVDGNLISGNHEFGIVVDEASERTNIHGNIIGLDVTGSQIKDAHGNSFGNGFDGIRIGFNQGAASETAIGNSVPRSSNTISNNKGNGISIVADSHNNTIQNNFIGTNEHGDDFGNKCNGIKVICSSDNVFKENVITKNCKAGIVICDETNDLRAVGNTILSNSIFNNKKLGIDLGDDGITPNHCPPAKTGPNRLQNFPIITKVIQKDCKTIIKGKLCSVPRTNFKVQLFNNPKNRNSDCITEGKTLIDEFIVRTDKKGKACFEQSVLCSVELVSATATRLNTGDTSEFSKNKQSVVCHRD